MCLKIPMQREDVNLSCGLRISYIHINLLQRYYRQKRKSEDYSYKQTYAQTDITNPNSLHAKQHRERALFIQSRVYDLFI